MEAEGIRVIVAGAVGWTDAEAIRRELARLPANCIVIHGDAPGADALAGQIAARRGLTVEAMRKEKQDYQKYGRAAWKGLNERMLASGVVRVLAFHAEIARSRGTKHLIELAQQAGIEVQVFAE
jgi:hypothetical protein